MGVSYSSSFRCPASTSRRPSGTPIASATFRSVEGIGTVPWLNRTLSDACGTPARRASANCETSRSVSQRLMYAASVSPGCCVVML